MDDKPKRVSGVLDGWLAKKSLPMRAQHFDAQENLAPLPSPSSKKHMKQEETQTTTASASTTPLESSPHPAVSNKRKNEEEGSMNQPSRKRLRVSDTAAHTQSHATQEEESDLTIRGRKRRAQRLQLFEDDEEQQDDPEPHRTPRTPSVPLMVKSPLVKSPAVKSPLVKSPLVKSPLVKSPLVKSPLVKTEAAVALVTDTPRRGQKEDHASPKRKAGGKTSPSHLSSSSPVQATKPALPLEGQRLVVTGVFETMSKEEVELYIKRCGGHVTGAVSGQTDMLVYGTVLEDGRPVETGKKYRTAMELREGMKEGRPAKVHVVEILSEEQFFKKYPALSVPPEPTLSISETLPVCKVAKDNNALNPKLWTERWRPTRVEEILGNGETIRKLVAWLSDWHSVCILGHTKDAAKNRKGEAERINARAVLLSGPPGIGKTTAAGVAARKCGYEVLEYNASDDRGQKICSILNDMTSGGQTLTSFMDNVGQQVKKRVVLIMDEMDGLGGSSDRGGVQALQKLIDKSCCPIICICNDRMHPKLRTLASKCYDLRFIRPPKSLIAKRMVEIARKEGIALEFNAAELLCERVGNDIRQILNTLQLMGRGITTVENSNGCGAVSFDSMRKEIGFGIKDMQVMANPFDAAKKLLTRSDAKKASFNDKLDLYFVDHDLVPLLMEENYISAFTHTVSSGPTDDAALTRATDVLADVADGFTLADMLNVKCRREGHWTLLGDIGLLTAVAPSCQASGFLTFTDFPKWLGKNSTTTKNRRLLNELHLYLSPSTTTGPTAMRTSGYLDLVYEKILAPLMDSDKTGSDPKVLAQECMETIDAFGLSKDQVIENLGSLRLKTQDKLYDLLDSSMKRSLTTLYNSTSHTIKMAPPLFSVKKGKTSKSGTVREAEIGEEGDAEGTAPPKEQQDAEESPGEEEDDAAYLDRLFLTKKKKAKEAAVSKRKPKATAKKPSTATASKPKANAKKPSTATTKNPSMFSKRK